MNNGVDSACDACSCGRASLAHPLLLLHLGRLLGDHHTRSWPGISNCLETHYQGVRCENNMTLTGDLPVYNLENR